jgi:hypothetical protein
VLNSFVVASLVIGANIAGCGQFTSEQGRVDNDTLQGGADAASNCTSVANPTTLYSGTYISKLSNKTRTCVRSDEVTCGAAGDVETAVQVARIAKLGTTQDTALNRCLLTAGGAIRVYTNQISGCDLSTVVTLGYCRKTKGCSGLLGLYSVTNATPSGTLQSIVLSTSAPPNGTLLCYSAPP